MYIVDLSNPLVTKYNFSVMKNNNVDVVHIFSNLVQYASYLCYLKVESSDGTYVDEFLIDSNDITVEENALMVKWTMGAVSTQCKKINIQLEFRENANEDSKVAQSGIVSIILGDTIDVEGEVEHIYPHILKDLQDQIDELKANQGAKLYKHQIRLKDLQDNDRWICVVSTNPNSYANKEFRDLIMDSADRHMFPRSTILSMYYCTNDNDAETPLANFGMSSEITCAFVSAEHHSVLSFVIPSDNRILEDWIKEVINQNSIEL